MLFEKLEKIDKKKIPIIAAVCASVAVVGIVAFSSLRPENMDDSGQGKTLIASQSDVSEKHIYKKYSDQFMADADIVFPYHEQADVLLAKKYEFDRDKVVSLLFNGKQPAISTTSSGFTGLDARETLGCGAGFSKGVFNYTNYRISQNVKLPFDSFSSNEEFTNLNPRYFEVYKKGKLDFMPPDEAISSVKKFLENFGITVSDDVEIHALDCETMQEYQDSILGSNPTLAEVYHIKDQLTKDDEFYYLCFTAEQNGIPISRYRFYSSVGRELPGCNIKVCYGKDGMFDISCGCIFMVHGIDHTADGLLTAEEALDRAYDEFCSIYSAADVTVEQMRFEYVTEPYSADYDEVKFIPVWSMVVYREEPEEDKGGRDKADYIANYAENRYIWMIDAETGEMILNG